jgi:uncharacterized protein YjbI with pentapeptide repeats
MSAKQERRREPRVDEQLATECSAIDDETDITDALVRGDFSATELYLVSIRQCRVEGALFTGSRLVRASFVDCVIVDSDLSGVRLEDCRLERVELRRCRVSGLQATRTQFADVALVDCKADAASFRMTVWERAEFRDCNLVESDFTGAKLPGTRLEGCDLAKADLTKADLTGTRLHRSNLADVRGGDALRGVTIGSDQLIPVALAVFASMKIRIDDD